MMCADLLVTGLRWSLAIPGHIGSDCNRYPRVSGSSGRRAYWRIPTRTSLPTLFGRLIHEFPASFVDLEPCATQRMPVCCGGDLSRSSAIQCCVYQNVTRRH
ncbi:hypothetical protein EDB86DRAFT_2982804 [Lactarius hatsudake]|nr:hypothetical protein EDB86DRAFT_2982804 [Lactarius hatsudake]